MKTDKDKHYEHIVSSIILANKEYPNGFCEKLLRGNYYIKTGHIIKTTIGTEYIIENIDCVDLEEGFIKVFVKELNKGE